MCKEVRRRACPLRFLLRLCIGLATIFAANSGSSNFLKLISATIIVFQINPQRRRQVPKQIQKMWPPICSFMLFNVFDLNGSNFPSDPCSTQSTVLTAADLDDTEHTHVPRRSGLYNICEFLWLLIRFSLPMLRTLCAKRLHFLAIRHWQSSCVQQDAKLTYL